ncbi:MAG: T9SS type A sorting domain-containing protein [Flavobacteriales bacterium]|nr:T9SS type A sorting domain-containing protein [Flavobacteriales bacterium]
MRTLISTAVVLTLCVQVGYAQAPNESKVNNKPAEVVSAEVGGSSNFVVSPNPSKGIIELSGITETTLVEVLDKNGDVVASATGSNKIDLSSIPDGPYFVRKASDEGAVTKRIVLIK